MARAVYVATAPVQADKSHPAGIILWPEHLKAWEEYDRRYGSRQSAARIAERGGFGYDELTALLGHEPETWEPRQKPAPSGGEGTR